jgi:hypothetical protein
MILVLTLCINAYKFVYNVRLCIAKGQYGVDPHFIDVWVPMHRDDSEATQKLVSNNFNSYICMHCLFYPC